MEHLKILYKLGGNPTFKLNCNMKQILRVNKKSHKKSIKDYLNIKSLNFKKQEKENTIKDDILKVIKNKSCEQKEKKNSNKISIKFRQNIDHNLKDYDSNALSNLTLSKIIYSPSHIDKYINKNYCLTFSNFKFNYPTLKLKKNNSFTNGRQRNVLSIKSNKSLYVKKNKNSIFFNNESPKLLKNHFLISNIINNMQRKKKFHFANSSLNKTNFQNLLFSYQKSKKHIISLTNIKKSKLDPILKCNDLFSFQNISKRVEKKIIDKLNLNETPSNIKKNYNTNDYELNNLYSKDDICESKHILSEPYSKREDNIKQSNIISFTEPKDSKIPIKYKMIFRDKKRIYDSLKINTFSNHINILYSDNEKLFKNRFKRYYLYNKNIKGLGLTHNNFNSFKKHKICLNQLEDIRNKISTIKSIYDFSYPELFIKKRKLVETSNNKINEHKINNTNINEDKQYFEISNSSPRQKEYKNLTSQNNKHHRNNIYSFGNPFLYQKNFRKKDSKGK